MSVLEEFISFLYGVREELKKVVWPSKELVIRASVAVIIFTFFFSVYLWILDLIFAKMISLFLTKL
ncbi:MAG: preprotein translocase subunit SecE [Aquificota bacterium]|jgi:preprotein translocase subunit SecE